MRRRVSLLLQLEKEGVMFAGSDQIFTHIIQIAATKCGYANIIRADQISEPDIITSRLPECGLGYLCLGHPLPSMSRG